MKLIFNKNKTKGFTLVELVLYIAVVFLILNSILIFLSILLNSNVKNQTISEVEQQGVQIMQNITQTIRNAAAINYPAQGISTTSLSAVVIDVSKSPTIFDLSSGVIRIKEGSGSVIFLNNPRIIASELNFENFSQASSPSTIRIKFTLTHINPEGRNEYDFKKTFYGSAGTR